MTAVAAPSVVAPAPGSACAVDASPANPGPLLLRSVSPPPPRMLGKAASVTTQIRPNT